MSDNLESYFRKHLKEETPGPEQWNVPSDNVWEKVQPEIDKRKGIFIPWKYFYLFGIGLVLIISTLLLLPENKENLLVNKENLPVIKENQLVNKENLPVIKENQLVNKENLPVIKENQLVNKENLPVIKENQLVNKENLPVIKENQLVNKENLPVIKENQLVNKENLPVIKENLIVNKEDQLVNKDEVESQTGKIDQIKTKENVLDASKEKELKSEETGNLVVASSNLVTTANKVAPERTPIAKPDGNKTYSEADLLTEQAAINIIESKNNDQPFEDKIQEDNNEGYNNVEIAAVIAVNFEEEVPIEAHSTNSFKTDSDYLNDLNAVETNSRVMEDNLEPDVYVYSNSVDHFSEDQGHTNLKGYDFLNNQSAKPIPFSPGRFRVGAYYAPTYTSTEVKGLELPGNDQMGSTWLFSNNWGFDFYYYLSYRFTLVSGVSSSEIRSWSKTTDQFVYDPSTEHNMGNNQTANSTAQTSPTPFGALSSEVTYSFSSDANIPDGELMESVSETFQNIRYLTIPIGIEYNLLNQEKSLWFLETGVNYNISMRDQTELIPLILHDGEEMNIMDSKITQNPDYENNYWGFYIGTGYKYPLSKRIQLLGTVRYNRSISPLKSIGSATTNVQGYQLKIGVVYLLH